MRWIIFSLVTSKASRLDRKVTTCLWVRVASAFVRVCLWDGRGRFSFHFSAPALTASMTHTLAGNKKTNWDESFLPMRDDDTNGIGLKVPLSVFPHQPESLPLHEPHIVHPVIHPPRLRTYLCRSRKSTYSRCAVMMKTKHDDEAERWRIEVTSAAPITPGFRVRVELCDGGRGWRSGRAPARE